MKFPKSTADVIEEILICCEQAELNGDQRLRQLITILKKAPDEYIVDAVIHIIESNVHYFPYHKYCGRIISEVNPRPSLQIHDILDRIIENWDKSFHQIPTWFKESYGVDHAKSEIDLFTSNQTDANRIDKLKTMKWWLDRKNLF